MQMQTDAGNDRVAMFRASERLSDPAIAQYFRGNGHRLATTRALLETLGIPLPDWAERSVSGRAAATKAALSRFKADNPQENLPRGYVPPAR